MGTRKEKFLPGAGTMEESHPLSERLLEAEGELCRLLPSSAAQSSPNAFYISIWQGSLGNVVFYNTEQRLEIDLRATSLNTKDNTLRNVTGCTVSLSKLICCRPSPYYLICDCIWKCCFCLVFLFCFLFRATPVAYGGS